MAYSYMSRTGTQVSGLEGGPAGSEIANNQQVLRPVDDSTQNYGTNGEYVGTSFWNQKYILTLGYSGSQYNDKWNDFLVQGAGTGTALKPVPSTKFAALSLWPDNQANAFSSNLVADLPWNSRYTGTLNYTMMTQNAAFAPAADLGNATPALATSNLDGSINTLLSNNVITTKITPDLTAKTTFRYYDFKNNTPEWLSRHPLEAAVPAVATIPYRWATSRQTPAKGWTGGRQNNGTSASSTVTSAMIGRAPMSTRPTRVP